MGEHLRFAGRPAAEQRAELERIIRASPLLMEVLAAIRDDGLPDSLVVSGAIYNLVWNALTGRPPLTGINDVDVIYFDASDTGYDAEDTVIRRLAGRFAHLPLPVEVRNQARVHLWFPQKFGTPYPPLGSSAEMMTRFASKTHAVGARLEANGAMTLFAPFGLDDLFAFRIVPNRALANRAAHEKKAARARTIWPELTVLPWDDEASG